MSHVPSTPPEVSSQEDTPPESLLARLRRITGLEETELPPAPPPEPLEPSAPPVDRLIVWLREVTGVLTACGVMVAVTLIATGVWAGKTTRLAVLQGRARLGQWMETRRARAMVKKAETQDDPSATKPPEVMGTAAAPETEDAGLWKPVPQGQPEGTRNRLTWFGRAPEPAAPVAASAEPSQVAGIRARIKVDRRHIRRTLPAVVAVLAVSPALLLVPDIRYSLTTWLGWGNAAVVTGSEGWLFPRPVVSPALPALTETVSGLRAGGASVVVMSVPSKAAVYPEKLDASADGKLQRHPGVAEVHQSLTKAGAQLLDLGPVLHALKASDSAEDTVFRAHGSHWSPRAVEKSAAAAAAFLQQQPGYAALPLRPVSVELARMTLAEPADDLAAAFPSARWHEAHKAQPLHFIRLLNEGKKPLAPDAASPVLLIGGDAVRVYDAPGPTGTPAGENLSGGLAQYLTMYLSTPLDVQAGADSVAAAKDWLAAQPETKRKAKRFIVWVLADDELLLR